MGETANQRAVCLISIIFIQRQLTGPAAVACAKRAAKRFSQRRLSWVSALWLQQRKDYYLLISSKMAKGSNGGGEKLSELVGTNYLAEQQ